MNQKEKEKRVVEICGGIASGGHRRLQGNFAHKL